MKITKHSNFRVEATPTRYWYTKDDAKQQLSYCERIKEQILRHVDDVSVTINWDTDYQCEFCGYNWEVAEKTDDNFIEGEPICCTKANEEFRKSLKREES